MRVCYFGTYRAEYSRNRILMEGLRRNGVEVIECHVPLWRGIEDRVETVERGWKHPRFWLRIIQVYLALLRRYWQVRGAYDVMVVGYPGQLDVFLARLLCWLDRKPLVWDIFMSIYLIAVERGLDRKSRAGVALLRRLEWLACRLPDRLVIDTGAYADWFEQTHSVSPARFGLVPTGADDRIFYPIPASADRSDEFAVLYYGTFIPNHGVATIVEAAGLLADEQRIRFVFVGDGPDRATAQERARELSLTKIRWVGWTEPEELRREIADADLCLGVFGATPQSLMTVQNKIYECLAMGKPVVTGHGPAVDAQFVHGRHLYLCERGNPAALAEAILALRADPQWRAQMGREGLRLFQEEYATEPLGRRFAGILADVERQHR